MNVRLVKVLLIVLGVGYGATGLMFVSALTPGGLSLGLLMFGAATTLYLLWALLRTLWQVRELLMLSSARSVPNTTLPTIDLEYPRKDEVA